MPFRRSNNSTKIMCSQPLIECAQCNERLYVAEWSEYVDEWRVRHLWECDACGYAFETIISFAASALALNGQE